MVPVAFVAIVREDVLDHAIWTVLVVSRPVVADDHRHHSLHLAYVEAPVVKVVEVTARAMNFRFSPFL